MVSCSYIGQCVGKSFNQGPDSDQVAGEDINMIVVANVVSNVGVLHCDVCHAGLRFSKYLYIISKYHSQSRIFVR